jgi:hypothetical protein
MDGKTKEAGLYPKRCGFQVGHKSYSKKGMNVGQIPWNKGTAIYVKCKCLTCRKEFEVKKSQFSRGGGKYCSFECSSKKVAWNKGILETKQCSKCNKEFKVRPCEYAQKFCSLKCASLVNTSKPHWGKYKGINMRSGYEIGYAKYLDRNKTKWEYEPKTFDLGYASYTPDFYLPEKQTYVEIKGWMRIKALIKIKEFIKQNPDINYLLLMENDLQEMGVIK